MPELHRLPDDTIVLIRPIRPADKAELAAGLRRLSPRSVHQRFLSPKERFSATELRYLTEVDGHDHVAIVAESPDRPGHIVAVARYVHDPADRAASAEAAIVVADSLQGLGLGGLLADRLAREAAANGIRRFTATMLSENRAAQRLMSRLTGRLERHHDGTGASELSAEIAA